MTERKLPLPTIFAPLEELQHKFDVALQKVKSGLGTEYGMLINGKDVMTLDKFEDYSPINTDWMLAVMQNGDEKHAQLAIESARKAFQSWSHTPWQERIGILRKAAGLVEERLFELSAAMSLEVGKNRMAALGDVQETAGLITTYCNLMEKTNGFIKPVGANLDDNSTNLSSMHPYGVWLIITPFHFPFSQNWGAISASVIAGNAVIIKPATDTPWVVRLLVDCFRDAGLPDGVINFVTGPDSRVGKRLVGSSGVDGFTFPSVLDNEMKMYRDFASSDIERPIIRELSGKNMVIVSHHADLERVSIDIVRSCYGLQLKNNPSSSRIIVEALVYDELLDQLKERTEKLVIGDPTDQATDLGPVINASTYHEFQTCAAELDQAGRFLTGGKIKTGGVFDKGYFCEPSIAIEVPFSHRLWKQEIFLPIGLIGKVNSLGEAMEVSNDVSDGLTAGFYGSDEEMEWFFD